MTGHRLWLVSGVAQALAAACSIGGSGGSGGASGQCKLVAHGYTGTPGQCRIIADCVGASRRFDCQADGGCSCTVNDASTKTVPFDPEYCAYSPDAGAAPDVARARAVCGW